VFFGSGICITRSSEIKDGFLLPYHDLIGFAEKDASIDVSGLVLHAPDEYWDAFSMGAEHVTHDQAIIHRSESRVGEIAAAIGVKIERIAEHANLLEAAALWYRLDERRPIRRAPAKLREKLDQIAKSSRRLLTSLAVTSPAKAADGPADCEIGTHGPLEDNVALNLGRQCADDLDARGGDQSRNRCHPNFRLALSNQLSDRVCFGPLVFNRNSSAMPKLPNRRSRYGPLVAAFR
jgi:hypothetical protein